MQDNDQKIRDMHTGRLIRILSHQLKRSQKPVKAMEENETTPMQKHVLRYSSGNASQEIFINKIWRRSSKSGNPQPQVF